MPSITRRSVNPDRRASVEAQVLAATERLLVGGATFTELGVQRIAAEAGVARSTFYSHFRDKTDLLIQLASTMRTTAFDVINVWRPADGPDALVDVFLQVVGIYREYTAVLTAINEVAAYDTTMRDFWNTGLNRFLQHTAEVMSAQQRTGDMPAELAVDPASRVIVIGGDRAIFDHVARSAGDTSGDAAFAREIALIWWYGAYRRPAG
jgi:AcrR family transcriptional regulator